MIIFVNSQNFFFILLNVKQKKTIKKYKKAEIKKKNDKMKKMKKNIMNKFT